MTNLKDFERADGTVDWDLYRKAEISNGDRCYSCGTATIFGKGYQQECYPCKELKAGREVSHEKCIRCPACAHVETVDWEREIYEDGDHEVTCYACNKDYLVTTRVNYSFTSSPLDK